MLDALRAFSLAVVLNAVVVWGRELAFFGAAGCDGEDTACERDSEYERKIIWTYALTQMGHLYPVGNLSVPGVPAWLATSPLLPQCLFATLVDMGSVASFSITERGADGPKSLVASGGAHPVYASVTPDGRTLLVANYHGPDDIGDSTGASVASFRIGAGCSLEPAAVLPQSGRSLVVPGRQASAHPHSFVAARGGLAYACDLGRDAVVTYAVGTDGGLQELSRTGARPGDGPRHLVQHPSHPLVFVVNELANSVTAYAEGQGGTLTLVSTASTLPPGVKPEGNKAADIAISPDGSRIYASNRGHHNSVCVLEVWGDGALRQLQDVEAPAFPRGMRLVREGSLLLVAGQHEGVVRSYFPRGEGGLAWSGTAVDGPPTTAALAVLDPAGDTFAEGTCPAGECGGKEGASAEPSA